MWNKIVSGALVVTILLGFAATASAQEGDTNPPPPAEMRSAADVGAMSLPGGGWWTGFQVANVGTGNATVVVTLYDAQSSSTYQSVSKIIAPNASYTFSPLTDADWDPDVPNGFIGSAVISADQPILAIVNEQNNLASGGTAAGSYRGFTSEQTATRLLFPLVKHDYGSTHRTTTFFMQNASGTAANVYASFRIGSSTYSHTYSSVGPYKLQVINPSDAGVPTGSVGSLEITSTVQLAGVYNEHQHTATVANTLLGTGGFAPSLADDRLYVPIFKQNYNTSYSGLQVQNAGTNPTTIHAIYTVAYGGSGTYTSDLPADPGKSVTFYNVPGWPSGTYGSVIVTASQPLVAIVNESKYSTNQNGVYAAFADSQVTNCAVAPLWKTRWSGTSSGQQSTIVVQNIGSIGATVNVTFTMASGGVGTFTPPARTVNPGTSTVYGPGGFTGGPPATVAAVGSVEICATQPIAVLVQETTLPGWTVRDLLNYEAFNK
jgi:hypothetical protein